MSGLVIGIDLCDDYCRVSGMRATDTEPVNVVFKEADGRTIIQTALGKRRGEASWVLGKEAFGAALTGEGFVVDKLCSRLLSPEVIREGEESYTAEQLMSHFLGEMLSCAYASMEEDSLRSLTISMQQVDKNSSQTMLRCTDLLGIPRENVRIISRTEAFFYYLLSQKKELWSNESVLFDWSLGKVHVYRLNVLRGTRPNTAYIGHSLIEEDMETGTSDERNQFTVDSLLTPHAKSILDSAHVSSVFLSGKGFENAASWKKSIFLTTAASHRRVFCENNLFSRGAVLSGIDRLRVQTAFPYVIMCEGRITASITMDVLSGGVRKTLILARMGSLWYEVQTSADLILDDTTSIDIHVEQSGGKLVRSFSVPLDNFPQRPNKTTRVQVILTFESDNEAVIRVLDQGFGEFYPASGAVKRSRFRITE